MGTPAACDELIAAGVELFGARPGEELDPAWIRWRRAELARQHHPDRGGDPDKLRAVLAAADYLEREGRAPGLYRIEATPTGLAVVVD